MSEPVCLPVVWQFCTCGPKSPFLSGELQTFSLWRWGLGTEGSISAHASNDFISWKHATNAVNILTTTSTALK